MNQYIKTTIFSPLSELQNKGGFDSLTKPDPQKANTIARTGMVIFADGRKIDKDLNTQQNMSVMQFVPTNGYLPVQLVDRGINVIEKSLRDSRPDLTPFQIRNRPNYQLDMTTDKYTDDVFNESIAPRLSLLDDERLLYQQFKASAGQHHRLITTMPLTDQSLDKVNRVARHIENDSRMFKGAPVAGSIRSDPDPLDEIDPSAKGYFGQMSMIQAGQQVASFNGEAYRVFSEGQGPSAIDNVIDQIQQEEVVQQGIPAVLKALMPGKQEEFKVLADDWQAAGGVLKRKYDEYIASDAYAKRVQEAEVRTQKMRETGIAYYQTSFGKQIKDAFDQLGVYTHKNGRPMNIPVSPLTTVLKRNNRDNVHDSLRYFWDHTTEEEHKHFLDTTGIKFKPVDRQGVRQRLEDMFELPFLNEDNLDDIMGGAAPANYQVARPVIPPPADPFADLLAEAPAAPDDDQVMAPPGVRRGGRSAQRLIRFEDDDLIDQNGLDNPRNQREQLNQSSQSILTPRQMGYRQVQEAAARIRQGARLSRFSIAQQTMARSTPQQLAVIEERARERAVEEQKEVERRRRMGRGKSVMRMMATGAMLTGAALIGAGTLPLINNPFQGSGGAFGMINPNSTGMTQINIGGFPGSGGQAMNQGQFQLDQPYGFNASALLDNQLNATSNVDIGGSVGISGRQPTGIDLNGDVEGQFLSRIQTGLRRAYQRAAADVAERFPEALPRAPPVQAPAEAPRLDEPEYVLQEEVVADAAMANVQQEAEMRPGILQSPAIQMNMQPMSSAAFLPGVAAQGQITETIDNLKLLTDNPYSGYLEETVQGGKLIKSFRDQYRAKQELKKKMTIAEEEKIMQEKSIFTVPSRALNIGGRKLQNETRDRLGRMVGWRTENDASRLSQLMLKNQFRPNGAPVEPTPEQLEGMIQSFVDNDSLIESTMETMRATAQQLYNTRRKVEDSIAAQLRAEAEAEALPANPMAPAQLAAANDDVKMAQKSEESASRVAVATARTGDSLLENVVNTRGVTVEEFTKISINTNWGDWLWDKAAAIGKLIGWYQAIAGGVVAAGSMVGFGGIAAALAKMIGVTALSKAVMLPSISSLAGIAQIAAQTGIPINLINQSFGTVMSKLSGSMNKEIPSQQMVMSYLADIATRAQGVSWLDAKGYADASMNVLAGGMQSGVSFARNYLQPNVERKAAQGFVSVQETRGVQPNKRKTLNILGKRYKKTAGMFKMLTKKKKKA